MPKFAASCELRTAPWSCQYPVGAYQYAPGGGHAATQAELVANETVPLPFSEPSLSIDGISPTKLALHDGSYKLRRPLYLVYARNGEQRPGVVEFVGFIRGAEGKRITDRF